jgi:hypothetical protein
MGTKVDDYDPWAVAAVLYTLADGADRLARVRLTVASVLRALGGVPDRTWPDQRAAQLECEAARARRYARAVRERARRLTGLVPWRGGRRSIPAR